jgi:DNA-binding transcriptional LysR family regulator
MSRSIPEWSLYRSLLAVLREGSLSGAARGFGLTQPTLGRHIAELEDALGVALFTRSPQGLIPTDAALALQPEAERMAAAADALLRVASGGNGAVEGAVRVTASEVIGAEVLPAILTELHEAHPGLIIELVLSNRTQDLLRRDADIAVRMVRPEQAALLARRVGDIPLGLHAHRCYLERHGTPMTAAALWNHTLIGFDQETASARSLRSRGLDIRREMFALRADSDLAQLAALRAGFGIGVCQVGVARRDPDLVAVLPDEFVFQLETWVVMHEDLRDGRRYRAVFDALVGGLTDYVASARPIPAR